MPVSINTHKSLGTGIHTHIIPPPVSGFTNVNSLLMDGISEYAETNANYTVLDGAQQFTASLWVKPAVDQTKILLSTVRNTTANDFQFCIATVNDSVRVFTDDTGKYINTSYGDLTANVWSHIAVVCDLSQPTAANRGDIYINGIKKTTVRNLAITSLQNSSSNLTFAYNENGKYGPGGNYFQGHIDEVAIWNGTDLRNDVSTLYNTGTPGDLNNNGLTAPTNWWRMGDNDGGSGTTLTDAAGSANGTLINSASYDTDVP